MQTNKTSSPLSLSSVQHYFIKTTYMYYDNFKAPSIKKIIKQDTTVSTSYTSLKASKESLKKSYKGLSEKYKNIAGVKKHNFIDSKTYFKSKMSN